MSEQRSGIRPEQRPTRRNALVLYLLSGVGLYAASLLLGAFSGALQGADANLVALAYNLFYYLCFLALPIALSVKRRPEILPALRPNPISLPSVLLIVAMALLGVFLVNDITLIWSIPFQKLGFDVTAGGITAPSDRTGLMLCVLYAAVLPGVCEEFLFRGMLLSAFEEHGTRRAMVLTSLLFMLMHGSLIGAPAEFILGMLIAALVICTDSIYAGLIYHTVHNAATVLLQFVQQRMPSAEEIPVDYFTAIGGFPGLLVLLVEIALTAAMLRLMLRIFRARAQLRGVRTVQGARLRLSRGEWALLIAGVALTALMYVTDVINMLA